MTDENEIGWLSRSARAVPLAILMAVGLDLWWSLLRGYRFRVEVGSLLLAEVLLIAGLVVLVYALAFALTRRAAVACALAGVGPPVAGRIATSPASIDAWLATAALVAAMTVIVRRAEWGTRAPLVAVAATALLAGSAFLRIATQPPPGSHLIEGQDGVGRIASQERPNLILISLDTVRADRLSAYGSERDTSPWLASFAQQASLFSNATAASSYTLPSHASMFTGLFPRSHGADVTETGGISLSELGRLDDSVSVAPLSPDALTLAEVVADAGLTTGAVCANSAYLYRRFGLHQGFETYVDSEPQRPRARPVGLELGTRLPIVRRWSFYRLVLGNERFYLLASEVNELALKWLEDSKDRRFFLFLNYMDAHEPYLPIGDYRDLWPLAGSPYAGIIRREERELDDEEYRASTAAYDAEIRYLDDHLRVLFERLEEWGLMEKTVVIVTSDHGESFGEHGRYGHAVSVYQSEVHVPLIVREPGQTVGRQDPRRSHLVDVMPTALDLLGLPAPEGLQGASLFGEGPREQPTVAELGRYLRDISEQAVVRDRWKLIASPGFTPELYDLVEDPNERSDLAANRTDVVEALTAELASFEDEVTIRFEPMETPVDEEALERLRALGYVE